MVGMHLMFGIPERETTNMHKTLSIIFNLKIINMKYLIFFIVVAVIFTTSCAKDKKIGPQTIPNSLFFVIKKNNSRLSDNDLDNMELFYFKANVKTYINDFQRGTGEGLVLGVQTTRNIGFTSADDNIKNYYLEFANGDIDSLVVDYKHLGERDAFNNSCYCYYPLDQVNYNGQIALPDSAITQQKVFRFNKP